MTQNKKVIILKNRLGMHGGLEKYTWRIADAFAKKHCEVTILTADKVDKSYNNSLLNFEYLPYKKHFFSYKNIKNFNSCCSKFLKKAQADIIFGMDRNSFQTHLRAGNGVHREFLRQRKKTDSHFKQILTPFNPLHKLILDLEKQAFENPLLRKLYTNSHMVKQEVLKDFSVPESKIEVVHNGVEWSEMQKDFDSWLEKKSKIISTLSLDPNVYHFLFIGNGYKRKGLDVLLKALTLIKNEDFQLSVLGKEKNIDYYLNQVKILNLKDKVRFYGKRSDVIKFYQLSDALIVPSYYDPFANVTVEALAMGLQVISSPYNGGKEVLTPECGYTLKALSPDEIALAMKEAMSRPKTWLKSSQIRSSVKHLDFSHQIGNLVESCLNS